MRGLATVVLAGVLGLLSGGCEPAGEALGRVGVALSEDLCADYCLVALRATLYAEGDRALPLGPALQLGCGEEAVFEALPAGERVLVTAQMFAVTGELLLEGESEVLTIAADGVTDARVPLEARAAPAVSAVEPEPVIAVAEAAVVTLRGSFGEALGRAAVELGGVSYGEDDWTWTSASGGDAIALTLPAGAAGGALVVRQCGVGSEPLEVRVIGGAPGAATVTRPACAGASALVATAVGEVVYIGWRCGDGGGVVTEMALGAAVCPLDPGVAWSLAGAPEAVAPRGEAVWLGGAGGVMRARAGAAEAPIEVASEAVRALAVTAERTWAIVDEGGGRLVEVLEAGLGDVPGIDAGLTLGAVAGGNESLFIAATEGSGEGRLVVVPDQGVAASFALQDGEQRCPGPVALAAAADGAHAVIACGGEGVALWQGQSFVRVAEGLEVVAVALDSSGDLAFGALAGGDGLVVIDLEARAVLHRFELAGWGAGARPLTLGLADHALLMPGAAGLVVATPFSRAGPCAVEGP